jgi:hypothetical protein
MIELRLDLLIQSTRIHGVLDRLGRFGELVEKRVAYPPWRPETE